MFSYRCGVDEPMPGPVDADQADVVVFGVDAGLGRDLPAGAGRAVQPEHRPPLRVTEFSEADLAVFVDGDVSFELRTGNGEAPSSAAFHVRSPR